LIINTAIYIFYFLFLTFSILGYGIFTFFLFNINWKNLSLGLSGIAGLFCVTFISYVTHIFFAHNFFHNILVHIFGIFLLIVFLKKNFYNFRSSKIFFLIILFISSLFISKNHEDFPYYHLPYIIHIVENKLQFGIGLINYSYRTTSSLFYLNSTFYLPYIKFYLFHSASLIILFFANIFFIDYFANLKKESFIRILSSLSFVFINIVFTRIGGFGTDRGGQIIAFVIFILLIEYLNNKKDTSEDIVKILIIFILYIITIKSYFFTYALFLLLLLITKFQVVKRIFYSFKIVFFLTTFFLIFLFINFSNSGCLLYPLKYSCFDNFIWSVSTKSAEHYSNWYELWAKAGATPNYRVDQPEKYIQLLNWVPNWFNNYFIGKGLDVTMTIFLLAIIYFFVLKKKYTSNIHNKFYTIYFFLVLLFLVWFNKHPDLRYGGYVLYALLFFIPLSNYLSKFQKNNLSKFLNIIAILAVLFFNVKNLLRINSEIIDNRELYSFKNFPFFNIKYPEYKIISLNDNSKAYLIVNNKNDSCWATHSPCLSQILNRKTIINYHFYYKN
jgi:hypothetical protein